MHTQSRPTRIYSLPGSVIFLTVLIPAIIYTTWLSHYYSGDDLQYAMLVETSTSGKTFYHPAGERIFEAGYLERTPAKNFRLPLNPRYLLEFPTSIAVIQLWQALGYTGLAIMPVLAFRILVGCLGLLFLALAIFNFTDNLPLAALGGLGIAFSLAYWTYSTHLDQSINMIAVLALVLYLLARQYHRHGRFNSVSVAVPILMSFATLYNFTALIISGVISLVIVLTDDQLTKRQRLLRFLRYNVIYSVVLIAILVTAFASGTGAQILIDPAYWADITFAGHPEYSVNLVRDFFRAAIGFAKSQISFPGAAGAFQVFWNEATGSEKFSLLAFYGFVGLIFLLPLLYLAFFRPRRITIHQRQTAPLWLLSTIFIAYSLFNLFWDPGYIKYWTVPLICWWVIAMIVIAELLISRSGWGKFAVICAGVFIITSLNVNLVSIVSKESRFNQNPWLEMAEQLRSSPPNALFISNGSGLDFYIAYFARRNIVSLGLINYATGADEVIIEKTLTAQMQSHRNSNGPVYLFGFGDQDTAQVNQILHLAQASRIEPAWTFDHLTIFQAVR